MLGVRVSDKYLPRIAEDPYPGPPKLNPAKKSKDQTSLKKIYKM